jgi:lactoylglutathione lyase
MKLDGFGLFTENIVKLAAFYRDVLGFEIQMQTDQTNVFLEKDGTLFLMYGRSDFEKMTNRKYQYVKGFNGHFEIALSVDSYADVDKEFERVVAMGAKPILLPETEPWGQRTCYVADPEGNLIEIGSFQK